MPMTTPAMRGRELCRTSVPIKPAIRQMRNVVTATPLICMLLLAMLLSPAGRFGRELPQLLCQLFDRESGGPGSGHRVRDDLAQLPVPLGVGAGNLLRADEGAHPLLRIEQAAQLQFAVRADHSVGIDSEINRQLTNRGELGP